MQLPENNNQEDFLNTDENERPQDSQNADAAKFNTDEQAKFADEREETSHQDDKNIDAGSAISESTERPPLNTTADTAHMEEDLSGSTNLTLDQLKKEGDPQGI